MLCGRCQQHEVRVHLTEIVGSRMTQSYLCESCFRETHPEPPAPLPWRTPAPRSHDAISALDIKTNPAHFERVFGWLIKWVTKVVVMTPEQLYERIPEADIRAELRKAIPRYDPTRGSLRNFLFVAMRDLVRNKISQKRSGRP
jgi:hypothetical protein